MRFPFTYCLLFVWMLSGCSRPNTTFTAIGNKIGSATPSPQKEAGEFVALQDAAAPQAGKQAPEQKAKVEKQRRIRYTADMKLIVDKLDEAEESLDAAKKEAKGEYAKVEVNTSTGVVRSGTWRIRVPVENLHSFRKAVAKIGEVEHNTLESDDMTAQYYDLEAHIVNKKVEQEVTREFLKEIGKKDTRFLEVKRELDTISDYINREEGKLKLWKDLTDLTTFTVHMKERQTYIPEAKVADKEIPTFDTRASATWSNSSENFVAVCQAIAIAAIWITPWLSIPLVVGIIFWGLARFTKRSHPAPPMVVEVVEPTPEKPS